MDEPTDEMAPNPVHRQDLGVLVGILAELEAFLMIGEMPDRIAQRLHHRFVKVGLLTESATPRAVRQAMSDLNHRLRYVMGEYDEPIAPISVPD
jgi:hypothetical protein